MTLDEILKRLQQERNVQNNVEHNTSSVSKLMQDEMNKIRTKEQKENTNKKQDNKININNMINNGRNIVNTISSNLKQIASQKDKSWLDKYLEMQKYGMSGDLGNEALNKTRNAFRAPVGFIADTGKKGANTVKKEIDYNTNYYKNAKAELEKENPNMSEADKYLKVALQKNKQNLKDVVNVLDNARQGANRGITSFGKYAYGTADWLTDYMENSMEKFLKNHINDDFEKLINVDFGKGAENLNKKNQETREKIRKSFNNELEEYDKAIQENYEETQDPMAKKVSELSPSMGNSAMGLALNAIPGVGKALSKAYFMGSAGGSYMKEAEDKGANKGQAALYGTGLGIAEGATENLELGWLTKGMKSFSKNKIKEALKKYGISMAENFIQEASMEPIQETANQLVFGESDWSNMWKRMLNSGGNGALSSGIMSGASIVPGIGLNISNKLQQNNQDVANTKMLEQKNPNVDTDNQYLNTVNEKVEELKTNANSNNQNIDISNNDVNTQEKYVESVKKYNIDIENEAVKTIANMASQRGIELSYDDTVFTSSNQAALWRVNKETGKREVIINPKADSTRALQSIAVHEIVHDMENTEEYDGLSKVVLDYAKKQDNYDTAFEELSEMYADEYKNYKGKKFNDKIEQEMVADVLGEKLGNQEFINNLTSTDRNIAQKVYSWVVDKLNKINKLTGYKFEKLYWADVKNKFDIAFNSEFNNNEGGTKFSIQTDIYGNKYIKVDTDQDIFEGLDKKDYSKVAKMYMQDYLMGKTQLSENDNAVIDRRGVNKYTNPLQNNRYMSEKMQLVPELKNILQIAEKDSVSAPSKENSKYRSWEYYKFKFELCGRNFEATVNIGIDKDGNKHFYEINKIHTTSNSSVSTNKFSSMDSINNIIPSKQKYVNNGKNNEKYSKNITGAYQKFLQDNFSNNGTKTYMKDVLVPVKEKKTAIPISKDVNNNLLKEKLIEQVNSIKSIDNDTRKIFLNTINKTDSNEVLENIRNDLKNFDSINEEINRNEISKKTAIPINKNEVIKQNYKKYANAKIDDTIVKNAQDLVSTNAQGRRTKEQWLKVAEQIGANITEQEAEMYAYKTWIDMKPNNRENLNRQGKNYVKFTIDEWIDKVKEANNKKMDSVTTSNVNKTLDRTSRTNSDTNPINNIIPSNQEYGNNGKNDVLLPVNENDKEKIKSIILPISNEQLKNTFERNVDNALNNKSSKRNTILGKVKSDIALKIKNVLGIDVSNRIHRLSDYDIRHIMNQHSDVNKEKTKGQIPITSEDIKKIPDIIERPSDIVKGTDNKLGKTIRYIKEYNDNTTFVVEVVPENSNDLIIKTMWKKPSTLTNIENNLSSTSKTKGSDISSTINNIIPSEQNYVNSAKNSQKSTKVDKLKANAPFNEEFKEKQRKRYKTIIESDLVSKEAKIVAKELMGVDTYVPESNVQQLNKADYTIEQLGTERALDTLKGKIDGGQKITGSDIALGDRLIQYYSKTGEKAKLQEAIQYTAMAGTEAGRTVQAMSIIAHQSPEGQTLWIERSVKKLNQKIASKKGAKIDVVDGKQVAVKKGKNLDLQLFEFTADMKEKLMSVKSNEEMYSVLDEIYEELGQQVPKSTMEKIDSWRYFSMLANPTTHVRNIAGNTAMTGIQSVKNVIAGGIEDIVSLFNKDMERSKSVVRLTNLDKATLKFAMKDIKNVADRLGLNQNKYSPTSRIESNKREFKSNILNKTLGVFYKLNSKFLEVEDGWGLKFNYAKELTEYIVANKYDVNNITDEQLGKARNYAIEKAKEATFHQESKLASAINQIGNNNEITKFILDSTLPFKSVPINVAKTGLEYSPLQIVKSATVDIANLRNGKITVNQYIDNIAKGLTGTGIAIVGYALAQAGILKASGSDDDKEYYDEKQGKQAYSIQIGGKTFSLSWLAPTAIPLFIGVEIAENMNSDKNEKGSISSDDDTKYNKAIKSAVNILDAFTNCMNPMTEMSMLSGLTSTLKSYDQGSTQFLTSLGTNITKSYVNQFVPTILGKVARLTDDYERDTTSTKKGVLPKAIDSTVNQTMNKIPGLRKMLPTKKDVWGNEVKQTDNMALKLFENTIAPYTRKEISNDKVDKEINTLYDKTKETSIIPKNISKDFVIDGQRYRLTNKEYNEYQTQYGKTTHKTITEVMKSSTYKDLSDNEKADIIKEIYSDTKEILKEKFANERKLEYKRSDTDIKIDELVDGGLNVANAYIYKTIVNKIQGDKDKDGKSISGSEATKKVKYIYDMKDSDTQKDKLLSLISDTDTKPTMYDLKKLNGNYLTYMQQSGKKNDKGVSQRDKYMMYVDTGIPVRTLNKYYDEIGKIEGVKDKNGKTISGSKKRAIFKYINSLPLSAVQKKILFTKSNASYGKSYKREIFNYINKLPISKSRKEQIWKELYD